jgi:hypothetical protein
MLIASAILFAMGVTAHAGVVAQVDVVDDIYGTFTGSINDSDTGPAATLSWHSAVFFSSFNINLTNSLGIITDVLFSGGSDVLEFDGFQSGNPLIGTGCAAGPSTACLQTTGTFQDVTGVIATLNGGSGICCGGSSVSVLAVDAVPEPATATPVLVAMLAGINLIRRRMTVRGRTIR